MTDEKKIENAALYWYNCTLDGFPKGQKEVFEEWIEKDIQHRIIYERLHKNLDTKSYKKY